MFELTFMESRKPYAANEIIDLVYSLPQDYRFRGRLYKTMLLRTFSRYYRTIPWANIGVPISLPRGAGRAFKTWRRLHARLSLDGAGLTADGKPGGYADYPAWLRAEPARGLIERILLTPMACCALTTRRAESTTSGQHCRLAPTTRASSDAT